MEEYDRKKSLLFPFVHCPIALMNKPPLYFCYSEVRAYTLQHKLQPSVQGVLHLRAFPRKTCMIIIHSKAKYPFSGSYAVQFELDINSPSRKNAYFMVLLYCSVVLGIVFHSFSYTQGHAPNYFEGAVLQLHERVIQYWHNSKLTCRP